MRVSVIIPTYNRAEFLPRAIISVLRQNFTDFEMIVVDDGSIDNTADVVSRYIEKDPRIIYFRFKENRGGNAARNKGVELAQGRYIAFLDSDDEWLQDKLQMQVEWFEKNQSDSTVLYCKYFVSESGDLRKDRLDVRCGDLRKDFLKGFCLSIMPCCMMPKDVLLRCGGFDETLTSFQDYDLWLSLSSFCNFECVDEYLVIIHNDASARVSADLEKRLAAIKRFLEKWGPVMEKEVGAEYRERFETSKLFQLYYHWTQKMFLERRFRKALIGVRELMKINKMTPRITVNLMIAMLGSAVFNPIKRTVYRVKSAGQG
jgi:glycosyltransferase involved in cell wall biosynthesis